MNKEDLVLKIQKRINRYVNNYEKKRIKKPEICKGCKSRRIIWWSSYSRNVINLADTYNLPIKRVRCNNCGKTFALLPEFIKKYCRYGIDVIKFVLKGLIQHTFEGMIERMYAEYEIKISVVTLWLWKKKYRLQLC